MKTLILLLITASCFGQPGNDCPVKGGSNNANHQHADSAKNRSAIPDHYDTVTFDYMAGLTKGDTGTWNRGVMVDCWIMETKAGGQESCNCGSKVFTDTHIYLAPDSLCRDKKKCIIAEITPRLRATVGTNWHVGQHVRVYGWLFKDEEHWPNSVIDAGKSLLWRHTTFEIHPITKIEVL